MAKLSLTLYFVFFLSLDSFSQINKAIPFTKDSLYGSWMFQIMSYRKHTNRKRVYYYQNVSVYHFDQDSFKRIFYMPLSDSIKVDFGTYTLNSDTLILKRLFKDQKFYESFFRIETLNYDTIDIIGKYDHSDHARLTRLRPGLPIDTLHAYKILTGNICMIEYDEQENDKIENFKKIEYRTPPLQSLIFMHTNYYLFSKSEETRFGETNPRIIVDRPSNKAFLWFSDFQKPVLINQIIGDTIFGHEVDEKFKTLRIYPIDSIGMPRNYQGVWEISNSNSMKNIKGIKIKSDTVLFFLTNNKILETKLIGNGTGKLFQFANSITLDKDTYNYLFLKGSSSIENDKNKTLYTTVFLNKHISLKNNHFFKLKREYEKIQSDNFLFEEQDKVTGRYLLIKEEDGTIWACLTAPNEKSLVEKGCFLGSRSEINHTNTSALKRNNGQIFFLPMTQYYSNDKSYQPSLKKEDFTVKWNKNNSVILNVKNEPFLFFLDLEKMGVSKSIGISGKFGYAWHEKTFNEINIKQ